MDSDTYDLNVEENSSEAQLSLNDPTYTDIISFSSNNSSTFIQSLSSTDFISEESYAKQLTDHVHKLKTEVPTPYHLDQSTKFEPSENNPKIELNLLLHGAIQERTLRQLALSKGIDFTNSEQIIGEIFHVNMSYKSISSY